jgi:hypothetical protein
MLPKIAIVMNSETNCGIHTYGLFSYNILKQSKKYQFMLLEVANAQEFYDFYSQYIVDGIIWNHHPSTMPWLNEQVLASTGIPQYVITGHDNYNAFPHVTHHFVCDPTFVATETHSPIGRPLIFYDDIVYSPPGEVLKIGSFGFGQWTKNFPRIVELVNEQFDTPVEVNINISYGAYVDMTGGLAHQIANKCREIAKPNVKLNITHDFIPDRYSLAKFLNNNDLNMFLYATQPGRGISSCVDSGLTAMKPMLLSDSNMYRTMNWKQELLAESNSIADAVARGLEPTNEFRKLWSNENYIVDFEKVLDKTYA